jgi:hypothetical protein
MRHAVKPTALQQLEERSLACNASGWPKAILLPVTAHLSLRAAYWNDTV